MESAVILIVATTGCLLRREPAWIDFAVFGWGGLVLAFGPRCNEVPVPRPVTTYLLRFTLRLMLGLGLATIPSWPALAEQPARDVTARARAIGTDKPQNEPARLIITSPDRARLKFPAFVLGIEKASRKIIGCPPDRGLDMSRAPKAVRDQIHRTFHDTPLASDCLFVSHIAEFVATADPGVFTPVLRYDAYREADPPAPRDVFMSGREATLGLRDRVKEIATERASLGRPVSHLIVFATGWHTPQARTLADMGELFGSITAAAVGDHAFSPLFFGIAWPSFSDEIAGTIETLAGLRRQLKPAKGLTTLTRFLNDLEIADKLGFVGYPAISKDADEVGMVPASTLVNQVLVPRRETLPGNPRVVVIGHSFGARVASWTPFTAPLLPAVADTSASAGPDLVIGLQGAFPAARFDTTVKHRRPYVEGASFADHTSFRTVFAYTCANDDALRLGRIFDVMIGDAQAFERARATKSPAFSTYKATDIEAAGLTIDPVSRKVLLIDARDIISSHNDVRNDRIGRLVWALMKNFAPH
jgi:pimeloyl-ACP methyl ester carboxylesterase